MAMERTLAAMGAFRERQNQINRFLMLQAVWRQMEFTVEEESATKLRKMIEAIILERGDFRIADFKEEVAKIKMDDFSRAFVDRLLGFWA